MNSTEYKMVLSIALVFSLRMLGLFMILPIIGFYADEIPEATPALVGWAVGIYGLAQAICQTIFGQLSDKYGRKAIVLVGLALFVLGSLMAVFSTSIWGLIIARAIQGMGAIGAVLLAWLSDSTRDHVRTQAMAIVGISIGLSFGVAFIFGPVLAARIGLSGLFILMAALGSTALVWVKNLPEHSEGFIKGKASNLVTDGRSMVKTARELKNIWGFIFGVFALHALFTASFLFLPEQILHSTGLLASQTGYVYVPAFLISFLVVFPLARKTGKQSLTAAKKFMRLAIFTLSLALAYLLLPASIHQSGLVSILIGLSIFFSAFNFLEAFMPSYLSQIASSGQKGMALGVYSTAQFLGVFFGGAMGGLFKQHFNEISMVFFVLALGSIWLFSTIFLNYQKRSSVWLEE